jgi:hypothetical protein
MVVEAIGILGSRILARDAGSEIGCSKADGGHRQEKVEFSHMRP